MKKTILLLVFALFCSFKISALTKVSGKVINRFGNPVYGATITVYQNNQKLISIKGKSDGTFSDRFYTGSYALLISAPNYNPLLKQISVTSQSDINIGNIQLADCNCTLTKKKLNPLCFEFKVSNYYPNVHKLSYKITGYKYSNSGDFDGTYSTCFPTDEKYTRTYNVTVTIKDKENNKIKDLKTSVTVTKAYSVTVEVAKSGKLFGYNNSQYFRCPISISAGPSNGLKEIYIYGNKRYGSRSGYYQPGNSDQKSKAKPSAQLAGIHEFYPRFHKTKYKDYDSPLVIEAIDKSGKKKKTIRFNPWPYIGELSEPNASLKSETNMKLEEDNSYLYNFIDETKSESYQENNIDEVKAYFNIEKTIIDEQISIYPTVVNDKVTIESCRGVINNVLITSISGKLVKSINSDTKKLEIDLNHVEKGIYLVKIETDEKIIHTNKIIKQ